MVSGKPELSAADMYAAALFRHISKSGQISHPKGLGGSVRTGRGYLCFYEFVASCFLYR
jgi:hypothetical protein